MKYWGYIFLLFGRLVLFPVYFLAGFMPRRSDLWAFGSWGGHRFADNSAAFFMYCQTTVSEHIDLVWISRNRKIVSHLREQGYKAYWIWSPGGVVSALRSGVHIFDCFPKDTNYWLSRGAYRVNLWSGVPLKVFERDIDNPSNRYYRLFHGNIVERTFLSFMMPWHVTKPDILIATSPETASITSRAFAVDESKVFVTGFPRNDALINSSISAVRDNQNIPQVFLDAVGGKATVFLYLPTFRDNGAQFIDFDWEELDKEIGKMGAKLFYKKHPDDRRHYAADFANIIQLPSSAEVNSLLLGADALISDYSSVIFDYMFLNRPIVYYIPDYKEFESGCRAFNFHPQEVAVGPICASFGELLNALGQIAAGAANIASGNRDAVMERLHTYCDAQSNDRVLALIEQQFFADSLRRNDDVSPAQTAGALENVRM